MNYVVYQGRQELSGERQLKEMRTYDLLDELNIEYLRVDHEALETMEACQEVDKLLGAAMCKNLFLCNAQKTKFYLLLMPGDKKFKTKDLSKQIGSARLSFGPSEDMGRLLDITPGSVSVMGLMNDKNKEVSLIIDKDLLEEEYFSCHPCINTSSIRLRTEDLLDKFLPKVGHKAVVVSL
ncbi:MAG: prolyl-tRNA synthetase associated domain-containing protein [Clostridiales bacterium]|nr:prolyl-tRNA synthetase associated domain-containing protein [Clostridiales bacterium]